MSNMAALSLKKMHVQKKVFIVFFKDFFVLF